MVHEGRGAVCDVTHGTHGPDCGVHRDVVVLVDASRRDPRVDRDQPDVVLRDLGGQVVDQRVVDGDALAVLSGEYDVHVAASVQEQLAPHLIRRDVVVHHRRRDPALKLLQRILEVNDPHIARLVHGLAQERPPGDDRQRLDDLHRRLAHAASRGQDRDVRADVMLPVDPAPRRYARRVDWIVWRRVAALRLRDLGLHLRDRLGQSQSLTQFFGGRLAEVVVGVFDTLDAQHVEAHDVHVSAAVAAEHVGHRVHVQIRVSADRHVGRTRHRICGHAGLAKRADDCRLVSDRLID